MNARPLLFAVVCTVHLWNAATARAQELISAHAQTGKSVKGASIEPALSSDGRFVVFSSLARLTPDDTNAVSDVYLKDRETGALERISDERGGDQPILDGAGRKVVFRALDAFPKLRIADREFAPEPRTISFSFGGNRSFRYADSAAISPDGKFVAFSFRPIPGFNTSAETQLCLNDTTVDDRINSGSVSITNSGGADFQLRTLGRCAMPAAVSVIEESAPFFIETDEALDPADTNNARDIYRIENNGNFARISAAADGLPNESGEAPGRGARDPVLTGDGTKLFFISERQLRAADDDGGLTIYRSTSSDNFSVPVPIPTPGVRPLALSRQATANGDYIVFLGQPKSGPARPYVLNVATGALLQLAASAPVFGGAPAISADNHIIAYATSAPVVTSPKTDGNGATDIAAIANPALENPDVPPIPAPVVTLIAPADGSVVTTAVSVNLGASSTNPNGSVIFTAVEADGFIFNSRNGADVPTANFALGAGVHTLRALAITRDGLVVRTPLRTLVVRQSSAVKITGLTGLVKTLAADGSVNFSASLRVDNATGSAQEARIQFIETSPGADWEIFGSAPDDGEERLLETHPLTLAAGGFSSFTFASNVPAPIVTPDENSPFQGVGRRVVAMLQLKSGSSFIDTGSLFTVLELRPRLSEDTPGPNGGIPVLNDPNAAPFNPTVLQALNIVGPATVPEKTAVTFRTNAVFNTGAKPCVPTWSLTNAGSAATISPSGLLTAGDVPAPRTFQLRATFGGLEKTLNVTVIPVSPTISVVASDKSALEQVAGTVKLNGGAFKFTRSPVQNSPLTVNYTIAGTATPDLDYPALSGTVTFPAKIGAVAVPVSVIDDDFFEGNETVIVSLTPVEDYRLGKQRTATVTIADNDPIPDGQPDAIIRRGQTVGAMVYGFDSALQASAVAKGVRNVAAAFTVPFVNRTAADGLYRITGAGDFLGFTVKYFSGKTDVTADVVASTLLVPVVSKATFTLTLKITPTDATPINAMMRCPIVALDQGSGFQDNVEAVIQRIR